MVRPLHLAGALLLGACFTGGFLAGQPCTKDADCGPQLRCIAEVCGGPDGASTSTSSAATTSEPTTSASDSTTGTSTSSPTTTAPVTTGPASTGSDTTTSSGSTTGGGCGIGRCKDFDLVMVIDDSPSMGNKSSTLIAALIAFGDKILPSLESACSIHFGVITTDKYAHNPPDCQLHGALVRADDSDNECMFIEGFPYATLIDIENPMNLTCPVAVGSNGDGDESPVDAMIGMFKTEVNQGCNGGFLRPDSFLTVVLVTDEDDDDNDAQGNSGSNDLPTNLWYGALTNLKGGVDNLYMVGLLGDEDPMDTACTWLPEFGPDGTGAESAPVLRSLIQMFPEDHHAIDTLCKTPDPSVYSALMDELLSEINAVCGA